MKPVLCYFPPSPANLHEPKAAWVKRQLQEALDTGLEPALLPSVGLERLAIAMPPAMLARVRELAESSSVSPGRMIGMLLQALRNREGPSVTGRVCRGEAALSCGDRPEQVKAVSACTAVIEQGKISLLEVGTGVGKSRIAGRVAHFILQKTGAQVVVATPTISQCLHLVKEFRALNVALKGEGLGAPGFAPLPDPVLLLGRSNFIDLRAAQEMAQQAHGEAFNRLMAWLNAGGPAGLTDSTRTVEQAVPGIGGLMEDWVRLLDELDPQGALGDPAQCELTEHADADSSAWYERQRLMASDAGVIICTHAMLAVDAISRARSMEGPLPGGAYLIIDEAHDLEKEVANMASSGVSLQTLATLLKHGGLAALGKRDQAQRAREVVRDLNRVLGEMPMESGRAAIMPEALREDPELAGAWDKAMPLMTRLVDELKVLAEAIKSDSQKGDSPLIRIQLRRAVRAIEFSILGTHTVEVSLSRIKRMATIQVGPRSVAQYLRPLWDRTPAAVLTSATIYLPTLQGDSAAYLMQITSLPPERTVCVPSISPDWITASAELCLPTGEAISRLMPPSQDAATHEAMLEWIANVAQVISSDISPTARGGVMVLLSGYDRLDYLAQALEPMLAGRLVTQSRTVHGLSKAVQRFKEMHASGVKPVLLATGGAWTGLDLKDAAISDDLAHLDTLLTDLVIPNVPFGMNRTTTHAWRVGRSFGFESGSVALLLRQGLGRLIRRPGLVGRRIWMLDSRLIKGGDGKQRNGAFTQCLLMLERYQNRRKFRAFE